MQKAVEESVKPEHSPEFYQAVPTETFAKRCDGERYQKEDKRQNAGRAKKKLDRIRAELPEQSVPRQQRERHKAVYENDDFMKFYISH